MRFLTESLNKTIRKTIDLTKKARQKVQKDYDREYNAYKKKLAQYESYRDREYETQSQIYFSPEQ